MHEFAKFEKQGAWPKNAQDTVLSKAINLAHPCMRSQFNKQRAWHSCACENY